MTASDYALDSDVSSALASLHGRLLALTARYPGSLLQVSTAEGSGSASASTLERNVGALETAMLEAFSDAFDDEDFDFEDNEDVELITPFMRLQVVPEEPQLSPLARLMGRLAELQCVFRLDDGKTLHACEAAEPPTSLAKRPAEAMCRLATGGRALPGRGREVRRRIRPRITQVMLND